MNFDFSQSALSATAGSKRTFGPHSHSKGPLTTPKKTTEIDLKIRTNPGPKNWGPGNTRLWALIYRPWRTLLHPRLIVRIRIPTQSTRQVSQKQIRLKVLTPTSENRTPSLRALPNLLVPRPTRYKRRTLVR